MVPPSQVCPRCWTPYRPGATHCPRCGFDLAEDDAVSFIDLFGPPEVLRRYDIQDTLAHSRVGHIYRALDLETRTPCAIKELSGAALPDPLEAELAAARLKRRVRQLSRLSHPNLVRVHGLLSEGSRHFVVMDLVEGPSLRRILESREHPIPEPVVLQWAGQLCDALSLLHSQDSPLFFPDLSPQHVILQSQSQPVLIDLGLTRLFEARGGRADGAADDVAALGALLYQTLAPGAASLPSGRRPPVQQLNPDVSTPTTQAIMRAMSRRPEERFSSVAEFRQTLLGQVPSYRASTAPETVVHVIPVIEPYQLTPEQQVHTLEELVGTILSGGPDEWESGVNQFFGGALTQWLRDVSEKLQEAKQETAGAKVSAMAQKGDEIRCQAQGESNVGRQAAFSQWLTHTGYAWGQPELATNTTFLRLGAVRGELRLGAIFRVQNSGTGFLAGQVKSQAEWLLVRQREFGCRPGEAAEITVELRDHSVLSQPRSSAQALHITSNGGEAWISASVSAPRPSLTLDREASVLRTVIDFGEVQAGQPAHATAVVRNEGGGVLTGRVSSGMPWLRVGPASFSAPAGTTVSINVELLPDFLPHGVTAQNNALVVDSDYGQGRIEVRAVKVQPLLEVLPDILDFGAVAPASRISQALRITNTGTGLLTGDIASRVGWLTVGQPHFECQARETAMVTAWADPASLSGGQVEVPEALVVDSNGGYHALTARVAVRRPRLGVDRRRVDFEVLLPGQDSSTTLVVSNQGMAPLHAELVPQMPWLTVEPAEVICGSGEERRVELTLHVPMNASRETIQLDRALYIASDGGVMTLDLRAEIVSPQLAVDPLHLDFGLIGPAEIARGRLRLRNEGSGVLEWRLVGEFTWLEVSPREGSCSPGETATIEINGFALALPEGTTSAQALLHVESNGGHVEVPISVAIAAPALTVLPLLLDLGTSQNYASLEGRLRIANRGGGYLRGEIASEVDWLRVDLATFECATGSVVEASVVADPQALPAGETLVPSALIVTSNGGEESIDVRLEVVLEPILEVAPEALVFIVREPEEEDVTAESQLLEQELTLTNQGYGALRVRFQPTAGWLLLDRGSATLRHGRFAQVKVDLDLAAWRASEKGAEAHLDIRVGEDTLISISVTVVESASPGLDEG